MRDDRHAAVTEARRLGLLPELEPLSPGALRVLDVVIDELGDPHYFTGSSARELGAWLARLLEVQGE